ncbi:Protein CBG27348 [Caenorhabditis briggsae]|uniref:Protein CBG27348 n=1 Tax=Caenorhabditis briggsae TaxID=6238 RepID=B6IGE9_CAEBR|nr:Protein CBG27348 [Caenorhabditis briggsae]CAR98979.1 Protein CBG27348 [Caenorhabditis briggsae]
MIVRATVVSFLVYFVSKLSLESRLTAIWLHCTMILLLLGSLITEVITITMQLISISVHLKPGYTSAPTAAANSAANEAVTLTFAFAVRSAAKLAESSAAASAVMVAPASIWAEYQFMDDNEIEFKNCDIVLRNSSAS